MKVDENICGATCISDAVFPLDFDPIFVKYISTRFILVSRPAPQFCTNVPFCGLCYLQHRAVLVSPRYRIICK